MTNWRNDAETRAKVEAASWFARPTFGPVFLAPDGRALRLTEAEAVELRAIAETRVLEQQLRFQNRAMIAIAVIVAAVMGGFMLAARLADPWSGYVEKACFVIYSGHGIWLIYEAWQVTREIRAIRERIAESMRGRIPVPDAMAAQLTARNPFTLALIVIGVILLVAALGGEMLAHQGLDIVTAVPFGVWIAIAPVILLLTMLSRWFDARRGVGKA